MIRKNQEDLEFDVVSKWVAAWDDIADLLDESWTSYSKTEKSLGRSFSKNTSATVQTMDLFYTKIEEHLAILILALMKCGYLRRIQQVIEEWDSDWITEECMENTIVSHQEIEARLLAILRPLHVVFGRSGETAENYVLSKLEEEYDFNSELISDMKPLFSSLKAAT
jgi:hypothetical protein